MKNNKLKSLPNQQRHKVKQTLAAVCRRYNIRNRAADEADFHRICKGERIILIHRQFQQSVLTGVYIRRQNRTGIYLDPQLTGDEFLFTAFHEIGHHFLHAGLGVKYYFNRITKKMRQAEFEADLFAELILKRKAEVRKDA